MGDQKKTPQELAPDGSFTAKKLTLSENVMLTVKLLIGAALFAVLICALDRFAA